MDFNSKFLLQNAKSLKIVVQSEWVVILSFCMLLPLLHVHVYSYPTSILQQYSASIIHVCKENKLQPKSCSTPKITVQT